MENINIQDKPFVSTGKRVDFFQQFLDNPTRENWLLFLASIGRIPWPCPEPLVQLEVKTQVAVNQVDVAKTLDQGFTFVAQLQNGTVILEKPITAAQVTTVATEQAISVAKQQVKTQLQEAGIRTV